MSEEIKENIKAYYIGSDIDKVLDYIQQKENIIKEVREYIENNKDKEIPNWSGGDYDYETCLFAEDIKEILEILDKVD